MLEYPSIKGSTKTPRLPCIAFYKYDGSNLRVEWSKKKGFYKFGTRRCLFDETDQTFGCVIQIFKEKLADTLESIFKNKYRDQRHMTVFLEFFGEKSFAGSHLKEDNTKQLKLIDVATENEEFVEPREFVKNFGSFDFSPLVIYDGNLNDEFIKDVKEGKYPVDEGVVCKGLYSKGIFMAKIKTDAYREKLKTIYADKWEEFWE